MGNGLEFDKYAIAIIHRMMLVDEQHSSSSYRLCLSLSLSVVKSREVNGLIPWVELKEFPHGKYLAPA